MSNEETELIRSSLDDFLSRELYGNETEIERTGISSEFLGKLSQQGFLAAIVPAELGGSGLDNTSYRAILMELARYSGSVALRVLLLNSLVYRILKKMGKESMLGDVLSGKLAISIDTSMFSSFAAAGSEKFFIDPGAPVSLLMNNNELVLASVKVGKAGSYRQLGFRGIPFGNPEFTTIEKIAGVSDTRKFMDELIPEISPEIASIAIGMAEASIDKAREYSKVRKAFGTSLSSFQPLAFPLAILSTQLKSLSEFLMSPAERTDTDKLGIKELATEFAIVASKQSLQTHGGYGYIEDFGIEKFYRDSLALNSLFGERVHSLRLLAKSYYGEEAGNL